MHRKLAVPAGLVLCIWLLTQPLLAQQITDATEYNVYVTALNETDPAKQIGLLDAYLAKYPKSVMKEQALEVKLGAQQKSGQPVDQTARDILVVNPNNARAELILSFIFMSGPPAETDPNLQQKLSDEEAIAKRALDQLSSMKKADGVSDADFLKNKNVMGATHYRALGVVGALRKDNNAAIEAYKKAAELSPADGTIFYQIAQAYDRLARASAGDPEKANFIQQEIWFYARAVGIEGLAPADKTQVDAYLVNVYKRFHGSDEGLVQLRDQTKASPFPPADFHVKTKLEMTPAPPPPPPPPPIPDNVADMSFSQIKQVLSGGGDKAKEVFGKLKGTPMGLEGVVVSATTKAVKIAVLTATKETPDAFDVVLTLAVPVLPARVPAKGKSIEIEGTVKEYTESPFSLGLGAGKIVPPAPAKPGKRG